MDASDENGDGFIEIAVAAAASTPDTNTILNVLWVFPADACPSVDEVIAGRHNDEALAYVPCGTGRPDHPTMTSCCSSSAALLGWALRRYRRLPSKARRR